MNIKQKEFGDYQTNCYIVEVDEKSLIIDPGMGCASWVIKNSKNPVAILITHGHFDHTYDAAELQKILKIPVFIPKDDSFMLQNDPFGYSKNSCKADFEVKSDEEINISGIVVKFWHFAGHTPGCSAIEIENTLFSGDFIFKGSIGRVDFPFSNPEDMKKSIEKFLNFQEDKKIYPGHGQSTTVFEEKNKLHYWLKVL